MDVSNLRVKLLSLLPPTGLERHDSCVSSELDSSYSGQDVIKCSIASHILANAPPYTALSYTWGDATIRENVSISDQEVSVTASLHSALQHLRKDLTEPFVLWVDAVCINQNDEAEKSEQVAHMRDIYSRAERVVTWLGVEGGVSTTLALQWMRDFGGRAAKLGVGDSSDMLLKQVLKRSEMQPLRECEEQAFAQALTRALSPETNLDYADLITGLQDLLERAYWARIWIVQEVKMAKRILFICGGETVEYSSLHHSLRLLRNYRLWQMLKLGRGGSAEMPKLVREDSGIRRQVIDTNPSFAIELLKVSRSEGPMPMMYLLRRLQRSKATDPRDRIFALLGIASDAEELCLAPDYSKTCEQVYTELARKLLAHGYFDVLSHCLHEPHVGEKASFQLQSWVPDWSRRTTCSPLQQRALDRTHKPAVRTLLQPDFKASGELDSTTVVPTKSWNEPLSVGVIRLGTIVQRGRIWSGEQGFGGWLEDLQNLSRSSLCRLTAPVERANAVWRTAVADQDIRRHRTKPRLSADTIQKLNYAFAGAHMAAVDVQTLLLHDVGSYAEQMQSIGKGRRPALLSNGCLALVPEEVSVGDGVVIAVGADVPYVLRRCKGDEGHSFIGEAFVDGCMDGECAGTDAEVQLVSLC